MKVKDYELRGKEYLDVLIYNENIDQVNKWGIQDLHVFEWFIITSEEIGELAKALMEMVYREGSVEDVISEGIQSITLLMKLLDGVLQTIE